MKLRVFLCHAKEDKQKVRDLYRHLKERGFQPWLDEEDLIGGQDWDLEIRRAVGSSDVVVVCLSNNSVSKTGYVQKEIRIALDAADHHPEGQIYIIPVCLTSCQIPERLKKWHAIDLFESSGLDRLERSLLTRTVVDALWRSSQDNPDAERDLPRLQQIRAALASADAPTTDEVFTEMRHSLRRLKAKHNFDNSLQVCMASRTLASHVLEMCHHPDLSTHDHLSKASELFDASMKHLSKVEDVRARAYIQNVKDRSALVKQLLASLRGHLA